MPDAADSTAAGYEEMYILKIVPAIAIKSIGNYSNHIFHTEPDKALDEGKWPDYFYWSYC